jgi:hypothetical protein
MVEGGSGVLRFARENDLENVQQRLASGRSSVTEASEQGMTSALISARYGHLTLLKWLLCEGGANVSDSNEQGMTALLLSARYGHYTTTSWLLTEGGSSLREWSKFGKNVWDLLEIDEGANEAELSSLLKVMAALGDAPEAFKSKLAEMDGLSFEQKLRYRALLSMRRAPKALAPCLSTPAGGNLALSLLGKGKRERASDEREGDAMEGSRKTRGRGNDKSRDRDRYRGRERERDRDRGSEGVFARGIRERFGIAEGEKWQEPWYAVEAGGTSEFLAPSHFRRQPTALPVENEHFGGLLARKTNGTTTSTFTSTTAATADAMLTAAAANELDAAAELATALARPVVAFSFKVISSYPVRVLFRSCFALIMCFLRA